MSGTLLIDAHYNEETRVAIIGEDGKLNNFEAEYSNKKPIKGNIYLAKIVRIEPAIQAAFIDYGGDKHGFIPLSEIHFDYFNKNIMKSIENELSAEAEKENSEGNQGASGEGAKPIIPITKRVFKIQEVISTKQVILVQAEKEVRGNKCAFFTTFITLPGRYCVLMPNPPRGKSNGISRKIDFSEKERLKDIVDSLDVPEGMTCIVRTAGENKKKQEIKRDLEYLCRLWNEIRAKVTSSIAPTLIHEEGNIVKRAIRDLYQKNMDKIIIQGKDAYKEARTFMKSFTPSHVKKIELYEDKDMPIFHKYKIEDKISNILDTTVTLPSGGSIVINTTEALTAIDVNSGKLKNERDIEGTALKTNLEAAVEIGRQIRLRDIAGIIVIDFIDMINPKDNLKIEHKMRDVMKDDYSSMHFSKLSQFGLMELSRQRLRTSLADSTFSQCPHCHGSGKILANETVALSVVRKIENFLVKDKAKAVLVELSPGIDLFILNRKRKIIAEMESAYDVSIEIARNPALSPMQCKFIVREYRRRKKNTVLEDPLRKAKSDDVSENPEVTEEEKLTNKANVRSSRRKGREKRVMNRSSEDTGNAQEQSDLGNISGPAIDSNIKAENVSKNQQVKKRGSKQKNTPKKIKANPVAKIQESVTETASDTGKAKISDTKAGSPETDVNIAEAKQSETPIKKTEQKSEVSPNRANAGRSKSGWLKKIFS